AMFFEEYSLERQPPQRSLNTPARRHTGLRPAGGDAHVLTYPWDAAREALAAAATDPGTPCDGVLIEYVNPSTGGPTLPTIGCSLHPFN
ncbi:MAG TPA: gentisate 1,2-dioxygenase, partial [Dehalococcoidia bacterium]|nr:gentisate 1,2-dioxygenase [Dehalococcoidia bacterium]